MLHLLVKKQTMKQSFLSILCSLLLCAGLMAQSTERKIAFICPPCGCSDHAHYEKAGTCTACGMDRVATYEGMESNTGQTNHDRSRKQVAIMLFNGVQIIDYTGPYEVFGQAGMQVFTVAESKEMITTAMGMQVVPHYSFEDAPKADIVVFPGGGVNRHLDNNKVLNWVKKSTAESETALSVCNGAYYLAETGLLDGLEATTFASLIPGLKQRAPKAKVVRDQRFVDNGKIVTTAGLSSGIDGALHIVSEYMGLGRTQQIATNLEYNWDPEGNYVRAALADQYLKNATKVLTQFDTETLRYEGNRAYWENEYKVKTALNKAELTKLVAHQLTHVEQWKQVSKKGTKETIWKVPVGEQTFWDGNLMIKEADDAYIVKLSIKESK